MARALDGKGEVINARLWLLWERDRDTLRFRSVAKDTSDGFLLPDSGNWVVEGWSQGTPPDTAKLAKAVEWDDYMDACLNVIPPNTIKVIRYSIDLTRCESVNGPTINSNMRNINAPQALSYFRVSLDTNKNSTFSGDPALISSLRALRVWKATADSFGGYWKFNIDGFRSFAQTNSLSLTDFKGILAVEGWDYLPTDQQFYSPRSEVYLNRAAVYKCLERSPRNVAAQCVDSLFPTEIYSPTNPGPVFRAVFQKD
jgi:hypothetical protein